jgi:small subunit ribosomal protein S6
MKQKYEALLVLDTKGKEEDAKDMIERLEGEFQREGAAVEQVQKMDKRQFTYVAGRLDSGFYANFVFEAEPQVIERLRAKLKLDPDIYRQHYQKLRPKKVAKAREAQ